MTATNRVDDTFVNKGPERTVSGPRLYPFREGRHSGRTLAAPRANRVARRSSSPLARRHNGKSGGEN
ncbi:unnamed protein product, partial [Brenthis ino]